MDREVAPSRAVLLSSVPPGRRGSSFSVAAQPGPAAAGAGEGPGLRPGQGRPGPARPHLPPRLVRCGSGGAAPGAPRGRRPLLCRSLRPPPPGVRGSGPAGRGGRDAEGLSLPPPPLPVPEAPCPCRRLLRGTRPAVPRQPRGPREDMGCM